MDIKAHPHAGIAPTTYLISGSGRHTDSLGQRHRLPQGRVHAVQFPDAAPSTKRCPAMRFAATAGRFTDFKSGSTHRRRRSLQPLDRHSRARRNAHHCARRRGNQGHDWLPERMRLTGVHVHTRLYYHITLPAGGRLDLPVDPTQRLCPRHRGQARGRRPKPLRDEQLALYDRGGDVMRFHALEDSEFWFSAANPLNEPLVSYGPFVMNSQDQINACIRNYRGRWQDGACGSRHATPPSRSAQ